MKKLFSQMTPEEQIADYKKRVGDRPCQQCGEPLSEGIPYSGETTFCCDECEEQFNEEAEAEADDEADTH